MGCDIHPMCQRRGVYDVGELSDFDHWECAGVPDDGRNYAFFEALVGVRSHDTIPPLSEPRGEHEDWSEYWNAATRAELEYGDHSLSWCLLSEMEARDEAWFTKYGERGAAAWKTWHRWLEYGRMIAVHFGLQPEHVRFVFNFDN